MTNVYDHHWTFQVKGVSHKRETDYMISSNSILVFLAFVPDEQRLKLVIGFKNLVHAVLQPVVSNILEFWNVKRPPSPQPHISIEFTCGTADPDNIRRKTKHQKIIIFDNYGSSKLKPCQSTFWVFCSGIQCVNLWSWMIIWQISKRINFRIE